MFQNSNYLFKKFKLFLYIFVRTDKIALYSNNPIGIACVKKDVYYFSNKKITFVLNFSDTFSANSGLDDPFGMTSFSSAPAIAKPLIEAVNPNPLASLDDLDPFKNL